MVKTACFFKYCPSLSLPIKKPDMKSGFFIGGGKREDIPILSE